MGLDYQSQKHFYYVTFLEVSHAYKITMPIQFCNYLWVTACYCVEPEIQLQWIFHNVLMYHQYILELTITFQIHLVYVVAIYATNPVMYLHNLVLFILNTIISYAYSIYIYI